LARKIEAHEMIDDRDDDLFPPPPAPGEPGASGNGSPPEDPAPPRYAPQDSLSPLSGDPLSYAARASEGAAGESPNPVLLPADLCVSWSWIHLLVFLFAVVVSALVVPLIIVAGVAAYTHQSNLQLQQLLEKPAFLVVSQVLVFGTVLFFLYMTLAVLRDAPFWRTLGWRKLPSGAQAGRYRPWMFFATGSGLAIFVAAAGSRVKDSENAPIEQLFKNPHAALLLMAMAVLVAPLVEETVFRGYLYPLFAAKLSKLAGIFGFPTFNAVRFGTASGILITGVLFGLMHGSQLGWNWGLVSLLTLVGIIFTFARASTGTVLASFLMHLGYNSMIAVTSILVTKGFTQMPPGH
jgi:membrane protease YdiL (CAAX protease family)